MGLKPFLVSPVLSPRFMEKLVRFCAEKPEDALYPDYLSGPGAYVVYEGNLIRNTQEAVDKAPPAESDSRFVVVEYGRTPLSGRSGESSPCLMRTGSERVAQIQAHCREHTAK